MLEKWRKWYRALPDKKRYIEFLTASLSVPVLITVIILNVSNLKSRNKEEVAPVKQETKEKIIIITLPVEKNNPQPNISETITPLPSPTIEPTPTSTPTPTPSPTLTISPSLTPDL